MMSSFFLDLLVCTALAFIIHLTLVELDKSEKNRWGSVNGYNVVLPFYVLIISLRCIWEFRCYIKNLWNSYASLQLQQLNWVDCSKLTGKHILFILFVMAFSIAGVSVYRLCSSKNLSLNIAIMVCVPPLIIQCILMHIVMEDVIVKGLTSYWQLPLWDLDKQYFSLLFILTPSKVCQSFLLSVVIWSFISYFAFLCYLEDEVVLAKTLLHLCRMYVSLHFLLFSGNLFTLTITYNLVVVVALLFLCFGVSQHKRFKSDIKIPQLNWVQMIMLGIALLALCNIILYRIFHRWGW